MKKNYVKKCLALTLAFSMTFSTVAFADTAKDTYTNEQGSGENGTIEPGATTPGTTEPGTTEPGTTEPGFWRRQLLCYGSGERPEKRWKKSKECWTLP